MSLSFLFQFWCLIYQWLLILQKAAGKIHTDMQRGFIKADVIGCKELLSIGSMHRAKEEGKVRVEGREYMVKNEDVILIKFSV
ncbi:MAG: DUF933 domain-containing protein [Candidatus Humimicrobiaceae bacterium]